MLHWYNFKSKRAKNDMRLCNTLDLDLDQNFRDSIKSLLYSYVAILNDTYLKTNRKQ